MVDGRTPTNGRRLDGYTIRLPYEPNGSGELIMSGQTFHPKSKGCACLTLPYGSIKKSSSPGDNKNTEDQGTCKCSPDILA